MDYACPRCRSEKTQSARMAILEGTYRGEQSGWLFGVALGLGGMLGLGGGSAGLELRNGIARGLVLPPEPQRKVAGAVVGGIMVVLGLLAALSGESGTNGGRILGLIMIVAGAVFMVRTLIENSSLPRRRAAWQQRMDEMHDAWICLRCGHQWSRGDLPG